MRSHRPSPRTTPPFWALRVLATVLLCLLGRAHPTMPSGWRSVPAGPEGASRFAGEAVGVAPAPAPAPSLERGSSKAARAELRDAGDVGATVFGLPPPLPPPLGRAGAASAPGARDVGPPAGRLALLRPVARSPPPAA